MSKRETLILYLVPSSNKVFLSTFILMFREGTISVFYLGSEFDSASFKNLMGLCEESLSIEIYPAETLLTYFPMIILPIMSSNNLGISTLCQESSSKVGFS